MQNWKITVIAISVLVIIIIGMLSMQGNERDTEVTRKQTKVGFIYNGTIDDKGWGQAHYEGISKTAEQLNLKIIYKESVPFDDTCMTVMQNMIDQGCEIIICNSFDFICCKKAINRKANKNNSDYKPVIAACQYFLENRGAGRRLRRGAARGGDIFCKAKIRLLSPSSQIKNAHLQYHQAVLQSLKNRNPDSMYEH
mgnify:CR=1 FL=1